MRMYQSPGRFGLIALGVLVGTLTGSFDAHSQGNSPSDWTPQERQFVDDMRAVYQKQGHFDNLRAIGAEIVLFAAKNGFSFEQIPVPIRARDDQPRFGNVWRSNVKILRALAHMVKLDLAQLRA